MLGALSNLTRAAVAVALTPATVAADLLTMPAIAYRGEPHPFQRTAKMLDAAKKAAEKAVEPKGGV